MSKTARRRTPPPPVGKQRPRSQQTRLVLLGDGGARRGRRRSWSGSLLATRSTTTPRRPAARPSPPTSDAPASLVQAADAVGFHPTTEPGVGTDREQARLRGGAPSNPNLLAGRDRRAGLHAEDAAGAERQPRCSTAARSVLLEFFATWCPHCNAEAPHLRKLYASLPKGIYAFVSVNADGETAPSVFAFHRYYGLQYPALVDPSSQPGSFNAQGAAGPVTTALPRRRPSRPST